MKQATQLAIDLTRDLAGGALTDAGFHEEADRLAECTIRPTVYIPFPAKALTSVHAAEQRIDITLQALKTPVLAAAHLIHAAAELAVPLPPYNGARELEDLYLEWMTAQYLAITKASRTLEVRRFLAESGRTNERRVAEFVEGLDWLKDLLAAHGHPFYLDAPDELREELSVKIEALRGRVPGRYFWQVIDSALIRLQSAPHRRSGLVRIVLPPLKPLWTH